MIHIGASTQNNSQQYWMSVVALFIAATTGISILVFPVYVPFLLLGGLFFAVLLIEKPEAILIPIAFTGLLIHIMIGGGKHPGVEVVYDNNNFLIVDVFSFLAVAVIAIGRVTGKVPPVRRYNFDLPLVLLAVYAIATLLWTKHLTAGVVILFQFFSCIILFYTPRLVLTDKRIIPIFLTIWLIIGIAAGIMSLTTLYVKFPDTIVFWKKLYIERYVLDFKYCVFGNIKQRGGGFGDPNRVAYLLNTAFLAGLALVMTQKKRIVRILVPAAMFFILYVIMHTLSKGGVGSLVVTFASFVLIHPRFKGKAVKTIALFFAAIVLAVILMSIIDLQGGLGRFGQSPVENRGSSSLALRFKWWSGDLNAIIESYGLGAGIGGMTHFIWAYAQSSYFSLMADFGFIGFLIAIWFVLTYAIEFRLLMTLIRGDTLYFTTALMAVGCVMIFFIHSIVDFGYNLRIPWLMAGLAVAAAQMGKREMLGGTRKLDT